MPFSILDSQRLAYLYVAEFWRRFSRRMALGRISAIRFAGTTPDRLVVAPIDLRIADPHLASEIYAGRFALAGRMVDTQGASPFQIPLRDPVFVRSLHGFEWLRHMRAANHELAFSNSRALVDDWIAVEGRRLVGLPYDPEVMATRLISWFSHSPILLRGADHGFYKRFLKSIVLQTRYLRHVSVAMPAGAARFKVRIALAMASLCLPADSVAVKRAARHLDEEFDRQILPDGGHISRNPMVLIDLLTDLLPLRQTYVNLGQKPPNKMAASMDRLFSALRFFRHSNGELALFNGATALSADRLLGILHYDETSGAPFREMPHLNYQRLAVSDVVVIADTGPPPGGRISAEAYAGCLSFEMSSGANRFIVNAGATVFPNEKFAGFEQLTAAHSTLVVDDHSSLKYSKSKFLGPIVTGGVRKVSVESLDEPGEHLGFNAVHDGYATSHKLKHRRKIRLLQSGHELQGRDQLERLDGSNPITSDKTMIAARFHVHPMITLAQDEDGNVHLTATNGESWVFKSRHVWPVIEEDAHFADLAGPRASKQIVLGFTVGETPQIDWKLVRTALPR